MRGLVEINYGQEGRVHLPRRRCSAKVMWKYDNEDDYENNDAKAARLLRATIHS